MPTERRRRPWPLAGAVLWLALATAPPALACMGNLVVRSADSCFAMAGCTWNQTRSSCEVADDVNSLDGDVRFTFEGDHFSNTGNEVVRKRDAVRSPMPAAFDRQGLGRVCPDPVVDAVRHIAAPPGPLAIGSASNYFIWPEGRTMERLLRIRAGWLSLREEGACRKALAVGMLPEKPGPDPRLDITLRLSQQARQNWKLARRGNPFNGVIDCNDWQVYLLPHNARAEESADQVNWTLPQLKNVRWSQARPRLKPSGPELASVISNGIDHGGVAALVRGIDEPAATFEAWCVEERRLKGDFLGFTVWTSQLDGTPIWKMTSRQLNGPNLDRMTVVGLTAAGRIGPNANLADPQARHAYDAALRFVPDLQVLQIDDEARTVIGALPLPLASSLVRLGRDHGQMPPPRQ